MKVVVTTKKTNPWIHSSSFPVRKLEEPIASVMTAMLIMQKKETMGWLYWNLGLYSTTFPVNCHQSTRTPPPFNPTGLWLSDNNSSNSTNSHLKAIRRRSSIPQTILILVRRHPTQKMVIGRLLGQCQ